MKSLAPFQTYSTARPAPRPCWLRFEQMKPADSYGYSRTQLSIALRAATHIDAPSRSVKGRQAIRPVYPDTIVGALGEARTEVGNDAPSHILAILEDRESRC